MGRGKEFIEQPHTWVIGSMAVSRGAVGPASAATNFNKHLRLRELASLPNDCKSATTHAPAIQGIKHVRVKMSDPRQAAVDPPSI